MISLPIQQEKRKLINNCVLFDVLDGKDVVTICYFLAHSFLGQSDCACLRISLDFHQFFKESKIDILFLRQFLFLLQ